VYIIKGSLKLIIAILLFIAQSIPIGAALDSSGLADDDPLKESEAYFISGYGLIAYSIDDLNANPDNIPANGISTSTITAQLKDKKGNDVKVKDVIIYFQRSKGKKVAFPYKWNSADFSGFGFDFGGK